MPILRLNTNIPALLSWQQTKINVCCHDNNLHNRRKVNWCINLTFNISISGVTIFILNEWSRQWRYYSMAWPIVRHLNIFPQCQITNAEKTCSLYTESEIRRHYHVVAYSDPDRTIQQMKQGFAIRVHSKYSGLSWP